MLPRSHLRRPVPPPSARPPESAAQYTATLAYSQFLRAEPGGNGRALCGTRFLGSVTAPRFGAVRWGAFLKDGERAAEQLRRARGLTVLRCHDLAPGSLDSGACSVDLHGLLSERGLGDPLFEIRDAGRAE